MKTGVLFGVFGVLFGVFNWGCQDIRPLNERVARVEEIVVEEIVKEVSEIKKRISVLESKSSPACLNEGDLALYNPESTVRARDDCVKENRIIEEGQSAARELWENWKSLAVSSRVSGLNKIIKSVTLIVPRRECKIIPRPGIPCEASGEVVSTPLPVKIEDMGTIAAGAATNIEEWRGVFFLPAEVILETVMTVLRMNGGDSLADHSKRILLKSATAVFRDENKMYLIMPPLLHLVKGRVDLNIVKRYWGAARQDFIASRAALEEDPAWGGKFLLESTFYRRWVELGEGEVADEMILVYRYWILKAAQTLGMPEEEKWAEELKVLYFKV